jgi:ubiquinone/menaquinone biosynthesis C-methylase UbiE
MIPRVLEDEVMDSEDEARDYDSMDHSAVNRAFAADFLARCPNPAGTILDVGTGTAQIPIELCKQSASIHLIAIDLSEEMLKLGEKNVATAGFTSRIKLELINASSMPYASGEFAAVISNSIIHHIPKPAGCFAEMVRVARSGATLFVRDLLRPESDAEVDRLVNLHAAGANDHQRKLFRDSLYAALTLDEVRGLVVPLGFAMDTVKQTSDRHWTWAATAK